MMQQRQDEEDPDYPSTGRGGGAIIPPAAPYPPSLIMSTRLLQSAAHAHHQLAQPPPPPRSSLSSSPHYSLPHQRTTGSLALPQHRPGVETLFHPTGSAPTLAAADGAEDGGGDGGRAGEEAAAAAGGRRRQSRAAAGVEFCRWDVLACINCDRGKRGQPETTAIEPAASCSTSTPVRDDSAPRKLGPSLLELRRLEFSAAGSSGEDDDEEEEGLFSTSTTLCVSRGSPTAAGTSVASTCLDVWRRQEAGGPDPSPCATGLTTGALCIHTFRPNQGIDGGGDDDDASFPYVPTVEHYHTSRSQRSATAVAWRPSHRQVAIGLTEQQQQQQQSAGPSGVGDRQLLHQKQAFGGGGRRGGGPVVAPAAVGTAAGGLGAVGRGATGGGGGDRECCCLVWDVEHQSGGGGRRSKVAPLHKLSHQTGVTSLAWLEGGQTLAVGGQHRNLQLFDLRLTGATPPPIQVYAHNFGVHGIAADPVRTWQFATFCRAIGEVVKLWDARRMDTPMTEIKVSTNESSTTQSNTKSSHPTVTAVQWSTLEPGQLSIVMGNAVYDYDASGSGARPVHTSTLHNRKPILDFALYPYSILSDKDVAPDSADTGVDKRKIIADLFPKRMVVVLDDRTVRDVAKHRMAPLAISNRDGRVLHALGRTLWAGSPSTGPTAIDSPTIRADEDISATMVRRARCFHAYKYAMNTRSNINVLAEEESVSGSPSQTRDQLLRLWTWIERVEDLCAEIFDEAWEDVSPKWSAKGLMNAGIWSLLRLDDGVESEMQSYSESLCCTTYESEGRRAALTSCGWAGKYDLFNVLGECEKMREYERSAALAVWHGDIEAGVDALQRGADYIRRQVEERNFTGDSRVSLKYAETLELVSLSIAGYRGADTEPSTSRVWRKACTILLQREDLSKASRFKGAAYLRHILEFLMALGTDESHREVLDDATLSLCDRAAFACRFLSRADLKAFLEKSIDQCQTSGNVEGLTITGVERKGVQILQSYVDFSADVQTAALVTSRVIFPSDWSEERTISAEWLHSYRSLLNIFQMWQSRATFDVERADLLWKVKTRQGNGMLSVAAKSSSTIRRGSPRRHGLQSPDPDVQAAIPAQLDARCNFCSSPLGLARQDNHASQWLSKMKDTLSCCPQCRKPLPRCAICMLSLGALNPYMELTKERSFPGSRVSVAAQSASGDLSSLASLPFAEWFSWCVRCKHGGHANHLVGWFARHEVCPVSGCDCQCQFDGVHRLGRPALSTTMRLRNEENNQEPETKPTSSS